MLDYKLEEKQDIIEVIITGEVDMFNAAELKNISISAGKNVVMNCLGLEYIDSTGLGAMVNLLKKAKNHGGTVRITGLKPQIYKLFMLTELDSIFDIEVAQ